VIGYTSVGNSLNSGKQDFMKRIISLVALVLMACGGSGITTPPKKLDPYLTIRVRDLGSRNGTFLNTLPAHNTKIQGGDEIRAGVHRFRVEQRV